MDYVADFETTTDKKDCRVWAWGAFKIGSNDFLYGNDIDGFFDWAFSLPNNECIYFHNLKFDGEFILHWLFSVGFHYCKKLEPGGFSTLISDKGQFYSIEICQTKKKKIKIYDSLKILPMKVEEIAEAFDLTIKKGKIDYSGYREIGHELTEEEISYLRNDVEIVARALEEMFSLSLEKMTIGSDAFFDYKKIIGERNFERTFPVPDYDADIRQAYKGGFTYLSDRFAEEDITDGIVLDVNSLYPSVMYNMPLPYGEGIFFEGQYKYDPVFNLYIQMIRCSFDLKPGHIPTIQLKNNLSFIPNEYLKSSDGEEVVMVVSCVDLELMKNNYDLKNLEYLSGWKFRSCKTMFREYIDKWTAIKIKATEEGNQGKRKIAKLMLNSLYGKFALNPKVRGKIPFLGDDGKIGYKLGEEEDRSPIYIPVGVFVTAWGRYKTITSAQKLYARFIYADTDSLHLIGKEIPEELEISPTKLGAWKHESTFTRARFLRQKTYIEEINGELKITCAGMPESCYKQVNWDNFHIGARYHGKLIPEHVAGGIVLKDTTMTII